MLALNQILRSLGRQIIAISGATDEIAFARAVVDSRQVQRGDLFFALPGQHHDGHDFIHDAVRRGARGVVGQRLPETLDNCVTAIRVADSLAALHTLASAVRMNSHLRVIGVTGSVGKTTCKEIIAAVLSSRYHVLKSEGNLNTEIGLPLTLLRLTPEHQFAVLEMAMYATGDIRLLCEIAQPQVGVVTNVGPVHLERLGSLEAIAAAKAELVESLPSDGCAVLNGDDPCTLAMADSTAAAVLLYGTSESCHVRGERLTSRGLDGIAFRLVFGSASIDIEAPLRGKHNLHNALAAAAVGLHEGMTLSQVAEALASVDVAERQRIIHARNGYTIIDDSYNASPASVLAALDLLAEIPGRRLALLGDMLELGAYEEEGHRKVGRRAAAVLDSLYVIGPRTAWIAEEALKGGLESVCTLPSKEAAVETISKELRAGDVLLVKGSRGLALETVVNALS